jgi:hypothetical protein
MLRIVLVADDRIVADVMENKVIFEIQEMIDNSRIEENFY